MQDRKYTYLLLLWIVSASFNSAEEIQEEEEEDPIVEDLDKVDRSQLEVISREQRQSTAFKCDVLKEEVVTYRYSALTRSGAREEVHLAEVNQIPADVKRSRYKAPGSNKELFIDVQPHLNCFAMDDPILIQPIKDMIYEPKAGSEYNFQDLENNINGEIGQPLEVERLVFGDKPIKDGFFIEAGSVDGEKTSNTLHFEINRGWTGLLVEPNPGYFEQGKATNRKTKMLQTCLSTDTRPQTVDFDFGPLVETEKFSTMGGILPGGSKRTSKMQCLPLYSILLALGNPTVHYFSLDIEGAEFEVLKTIPWDKVDIQALTVETHLVGTIFPGSRAELIEYMDSVGYNHIQHTGTNHVREVQGTIDDLFVKKGIQIKDKDEL